MPNAAKKLCQLTSQFAALWLCPVKVTIHGETFWAMLQGNMTRRETEPKTNLKYPTLNEVGLQIHMNYGQKIMHILSMIKQIFCIPQCFPHVTWVMAQHAASVVHRPACESVSRDYTGFVTKALIFPLPDSCCLKWQKQFREQWSH